MKLKIITSLIILLLAGHIVSAQHKLKFHSLNYAGILEGEKGTAFQVQSINGVKYKTWFAGLGTGIDYYYYRSIPLFISANKFLSPKKSSFFFSGDVGINFPWAKSGTSQEQGTAKASLFWAGGTGYALKLKGGDNTILFSVGYSYKHIKDEKTYIICPLIPPCYEEKQRLDYHLKRVSVKVGWMF